MIADAPSGDISFVVPAGWSRATVPPPTLAASSRVAVDRWESWQPNDESSPRAVVGCFGVDLGSWTPEAAPLALERLDASVNSVAGALGIRSPLRVTREYAGDRSTEQTLRAEGDEGAVSRTFLGFTSFAGPSRLRACFALCAPRAAACEDALAAAEGHFAPPPRATLAVRSLVFGVHHPAGVAVSAVSAFLLVGVVAVWTRPRPRRK